MGTERDKGRKRVLVVDDEPHVRELLVATLADEYSVKEAGNGKEALRMALRWKPDLILLDVILPQMDGFRVCQKLRASPSTSSIPVIFITAKRTEGDAERGLEVGGHDYFVKPFKPHLLLQRVHEMLNSPSPSESLVMWSEKDVPPERTSLEQVRLYALDLKRLYQEERRIREELEETNRKLEQRLRELQALNRLFQEHLAQRLVVVEAYREVLEGVERLAREMSTLVECARSQPLPDLRDVLGLDLDGAITCANE